MVKLWAVVLLFCALCLAGIRASLKLHSRKWDKWRP